MYFLDATRQVSFDRELPASLDRQPHEAGDLRLVVDSHCANNKYFPRQVNEAGES